MRIRLKSIPELTQAGWAPRGGGSRLLPPPGVHGVGGVDPAGPETRLLGREFEVEFTGSNTVYIDGLGFGRDEYYRLTNRIQFYTRQELLASGWIDEGGTFVKDGDTRYYPTMLEQLPGLVVEAPAPAEDGYLPVQVPGGANWITTPGMYRILEAADVAPAAPPTGAAWPPPVGSRVRLKTLDQLEESGWTHDGAGIYRNIECLDSVVPAMMALGGEWLRVTSASRDTGRIEVAEDGRHAYYPEMFDLAAGVRSPGVDPDTTPAPPAPTTEAEVRKKKKKLQANPAVARFRDAPRVVARSLITCGFELETQATEGHGWNTIEDGDGDFNEAQADQDIADAVEEKLATLSTTVLKYLEAGEWPSSVDAEMTERDIYLARRRLASAGYSSLQSLVDGGYVSKRRAASIIRDVEIYVRDNWDMSDYRTSRNPRQFMEDNYSIPEGVEVGSDGSVEGFEFRTRGPRTYAQFVRAARGIFKLQHEVDDKCSFHVHVGVRDVKHHYGPRIQRAMVEYLVQEIARVPASVRARWTGIADNQYIKGLITDAHTKYSFIHFHPQGTWEFRCFGAVDNARDGVRCLDLAIEALQFAYKVLAGEERLVSDQYTSSDDDWEGVIYSALERGVTVSAELARRSSRQVA